MEICVLSVIRMATSEAVSASHYILFIVAIWELRFSYCLINLSKIALHKRLTAMHRIFKTYKIILATTRLQILTRLRSSQKKILHIQC